MFLLGVLSLGALATTPILGFAGMRSIEHGFEQSAASHGIAKQIGNVAQMTDENSSATRETSNSAQELERLASRRRAAVERFRV